MLRPTRAKWRSESPIRKTTVIPREPCRQICITCARGRRRGHLERDAVRLSTEPTPKDTEPTLTNVKCWGLDAAGGHRNVAMPVGTLSFHSDSAAAPKRAA